MTYKVIILHLLNDAKLLLYNENSEACIKYIKHYEVFQQGIFIDNCYKFLL